MTEFVHAEEPTSPRSGQELQVEHDLGHLLEAEIARLSRKCKVEPSHPGEFKLQLSREEVVVDPQATLPGAGAFFATSEGPLVFNLSEPAKAACLKRVGKKTISETWYPSNFSDRKAGYVCSFGVSPQEGDLGVPFVVCVVADEIKTSIPSASPEGPKR